MEIQRAGNDLTLDLLDEAETDRLGTALAEVVGPGTVIGLVGPLGAGKTRLVRAIAQALGVEPGAIASPTFVLIHEYAGRLPIYHFDTYRLANSDEFDALGAAEYLEGDGPCLVEWADRVADRLPTGTWWFAIEPTGPESRRIACTFPIGSSVADRLERLLS